MTGNRYDLDGKRVLVTGGGSGIGAAIARAFADNGASVAVCGRREAPLRAVVDGLGDRGRAVVGDVGAVADAQRIVARVADSFGGLDVVVSNAAVWAGGPLEDLSISDWERLRTTNIDGFLHVAQASMPHLAASRGTLIAVGSVSGMRGDWGQAAYNASKHAVHGFVRSLALDWGAAGVRVNAVAPAFTITDMTAAALDDEAGMAAAEDRVALGRVGQPEDVAPAVLFLASADAGYVTGAVLPIDGGTSASTGQAHG